MKKIYAISLLLVTSLFYAKTAFNQDLQGSSLNLRNGDSEFKFFYYYFGIDYQPVISAPGWAGINFYNPEPGQYDKYLALNAGSISLHSSETKNYSGLNIDELFFTKSDGNNRNISIRSDGSAFFDGKITAKELELKSNVWADYVFDKNYKLMSLNQLGTFISQNKHLPNVPSASEVKEKNVNVGDMQVKLLEKVEELTLYILEQDKKIKELEAKLNANAKN